MIQECEKSDLKIIGGLEETNLSEVTKMRTVSPSRLLSFYEGTVVSVVRCDDIFHYATNIVAVCCSSNEKIVNSTKLTHIFHFSSLNLERNNRLKATKAAIK